MMDDFAAYVVDEWVDSVFLRQPPRRVRRAAAAVLHAAGVVAVALCTAGVAADRLSTVGDQVASPIVQAEQDRAVNGVDRVPRGYWRALRATMRTWPGAAAETSTVDLDPL